VVDALARVQVNASIGQRNGFQLTFTLGKESALSRNQIPSGFFEPFTRVVLAVTLKGTPHVIMDGVITRHEVAPGDTPGQSTLTVTGEDLSVLMDRIDLTGLPYPAMPPEARVALMLAKYLAFGVVPLIIPSVLLAVPNPLDRNPTQQGTDYAYLTALANQVGYIFHIEPGPKPGMSVAYWGPEMKVGKVQPALSVNMDAHTNVESLSVSFDGIGKKVLLMLIQNQESRLPIPIPIPDISILNPPLGSKVPIPTGLRQLRDTSQLRPWQAAAIALARASQQADVVSASGELDVQRYGHILKPGRLVGVRGAGEDQDGHYYVKSVTHDIAPGRYRQSFSLTRNARGSLTSKVAL
jgi:hypothetical protein